MPNPTNGVRKGLAPLLKFACGYKAFARYRVFVVVHKHIEKRQVIFRRFFRVSFIVLIVAIVPRQGRQIRGQIIRGSWRTKWTGC